MEKRASDDEAKNMLAVLYAGIGDAYMRLEKWEEAESYFKKSLGINKNDPALAYNIAEILFSAGKTEQAIMYYNLAVEINPKWSRSYKQLGYAYLNKGDIATAVKNFQKFLELDPKSSDASIIRDLIKSLK
jgi:tetratricopeptide (TPR) repeat protein